MEIKITISDTSAGSGGTVSMQVSGGDSSAVGGQQFAMSPEIIRAAAAIGAIDAGPAPNVGSSAQFGAPQPFTSGGDLGDITRSLGTSAGSSVAAMPVTSTVVKSVAGPGENISE